MFDSLIFTEKQAVVGVFAQGDNACAEAMRSWDALAAAWSVPPRDRPLTDAAAAAIIARINNKEIKWRDVVVDEAWLEPERELTDTQLFARLRWQNRIAALKELHHHGVPANWQAANASRKRSIWE